MIDLKNLIFTVAFALFFNVLATAQDSQQQYGANSDFSVGGIYYKIISGNTAVSVANNGFSKTYKGAVTIPAAVNYKGRSYPVTAIGKGAFWGSKVTNVNLPESVTEIDSFAFSGCTELKELILPRQLRRLGARSLSYCSGIQSVALPQSLTTIESNPFVGCSALNHLYFEGHEEKDTLGIAHHQFQSPNFTVFDGCLISKEGLLITALDRQSVFVPRLVKRIGKWAFYGNKKLQKAALPQTVQTIDERAFMNCHNLKNIALPNSLTSIGTEAFYECRSLSALKLPSSLTKLPARGFFGCSALVQLLIPYSVKQIGDEAFSNCTRLTTVSIPDGVETIGANPFSYCVNLTTVKLIPGRNLHFKNNCIYTKDGLLVTGLNVEDMKIPSDIKEIGEAAFAGCTHLKSVKIPNDIRKINDWAFANCSALQTIALPDSLKSIGMDAFALSALVELDLPSGLQEIGEEAFYCCTAIKAIWLPQGIETIGKAAFSQTGASKTIYLKDGLTEAEAKKLYRWESHVEGNSVMIRKAPDGSI